MHTADSISRCLYKPRLNETTRPACGPPRQPSPPNCPRCLLLLSAHLLLSAGLAVPVPAGAGQQAWLSANPPRPPQGRQIYAEYVSSLKVLFIGGSGVISSACSRLAVESGMDLTVLNRGSTYDRPLPE